MLFSHRIYILTNDRTADKIKTCRNATLNRVQIKSIETIRKRFSPSSLHARTIITCDYTSNARRSSVRRYRKICKSVLSIHARETQMR